MNNDAGQPAAAGHHFPLSRDQRTTTRQQSLSIRGAGEEGGNHHHHHRADMLQLQQQYGDPANQPDQASKEYLMSVLQALRNKSNNEGSAGIRALFANADVDLAGVANMRSSNNCRASSSGSQDNSSMNAAAAAAAATGGEAGGDGCPDRSSEYVSSFKRRKGLLNSAVSEEEDPNSDSYSIGESATSRLSSTASTYIAQLSCDIASSNLIHSASSSSASSSCSTSSPLHSLTQPTQSKPLVGEGREAVAPVDGRSDVPKRRDKASRSHGKKQPSASTAAPAAALSKHREDSIFDSAHSAMLQDLPLPPVTALGHTSRKGAGASTSAEATAKAAESADTRTSNISTRGCSSNSRQAAAPRGSSHPKPRRKLSRDESFNSDDSSGDPLNQSTEGGGGGVGGGVSDESCSQSSPDGRAGVGGGGVDSRTGGGGRDTVQGTPKVTALLSTADMSVEEILQYIRVPKLIHHVADNDTLKDFLDQHEISHLNHISKCFTDAILTVSLPESTVGKSNIMPVDFLDVYCCCVLRVYFLLFKNLDFMNLLLSDQVSLLECGVLKALLCMSFFVFKEDSNSWHIPSSLNEVNPVILTMTDLNQILPHNLLQQTLAINVTSAKLKFDWQMGMLCIGAFFYSPVDIDVQQIDKIDKLRDRYMEILLKYLKWKHGPYNATVLFPEILKLMDAILKHCSKVENLTLRLKDEEVEAFEKRLQSLNSNVQSNYDTKDNLALSGVTFAKINHRICVSVQSNLSNTMFGSGVDLRHCAAVPAASMYYSNLPLESEEAKSRRGVEALLIQHILQNKQQQEQKYSPQQQGDDSNDTNNAGYDLDDPRSRLPRLPPQSNMNVLAIRRLLLDLARKDQIPASPEPPLTLSPAREEALEDASRSPMDAGSPHHRLAGLPIQQSLQQKLYQQALSAHQQHAHLANFAKSLEYRSATAKSSAPPLQPVNINSRGLAITDEDTNAVMDLSSRTRRRESPSSPPSVPATSTSPTVPALARIPALKPLSGYQGLFERQTTPSPPLSVSRVQGGLAAGAGGVNQGDVVTPTTSSASTLLAALGSIMRPALQDPQPTVSPTPAGAPSSTVSQLSSRHIELLLESLGQTVHSEEGPL